MRYWLVMPAAGVGRRFGHQTPKQYADLHGRTVMEWALGPFLADTRCQGAVVALADGDPHWPAVAARLPGIITAAGGSERSHSVRNGLRALAGRAAAEDWVLVHDAARPCVAGSDLQRLLETVQEHPVGGILAVPAADTLKRGGVGQEIVATIERAGLWRALTPQMFRYAALCEALDLALAQGKLPTDEAQALEWSGRQALLVAGSPANIKITSADDLVIAAALLESRAARGGTQGSQP